MGPQQVQSDVYASSLCDELEVSNPTSAMSGGIVAVIDEGKNMEKRDISVKDGDTMEKRNNKEGGKPFINYNG